MSSGFRGGGVAAWVGTLARRRCGRVGRGEGPRVRGGFPVRLDGASPSRRVAARSAGLIGAVVRRDRPGSRMRWLPAAAGLFAVGVAGHAGGLNPGTDRILRCDSAWNDGISWQVARDCGVTCRCLHRTTSDVVGFNHARCRVAIVLYHTSEARHPDELLALCKNRGSARIPPVGVYTGMRRKGLCRPACRLQ